MIIVRTPLRVSFFGGGTDFPEFFNSHGGVVVGTTIDKSIHHTLSYFSKKLFNKSIRFSYSKIELVDDIEELCHFPFKEILRNEEQFGEIEVNLASDLPSFSGLGSSSSFVVGLLNGLNEYKNKNTLSPKELANKAIYVERTILKEYVGLQDQIFAAYGGLNVVRFSDNDYEVERLKIPNARKDKLNNSLVMVYTGQKRKANDIERDKFKDLDSQKIKNLISIKKNAEYAIDLIKSKKDINEIGDLFNESWHIKKKLSKKVSSESIDEIYEDGRNYGATGGKILGAGGGGFLLFYVPSQDLDNFKKNMLKKYYILGFKFSNFGSSFVRF